MNELTYEEVDEQHNKETRQAYFDIQHGPLWNELVCIETNMSMFKDHYNN